MNGLQKASDEAKLYFVEANELFHRHQTTETSRQALKLLKRSASLGYARAEYTLGLLYFQGAVDPKIPQNIILGVKLFRAAAAQKFAPAETDLGGCYISRLLKKCPSEGTLGA
jgi:TPR repeat protein